MIRKTISIVIAMMFVLLFVAACSAGGTSVGTPSGNQSVPGTGSTSAVQETPALQGTLQTAVECAGIDTQALMTTGQDLYSKNCASCHGEQGEGTGNFPALAGSQIATAADVQQLVQGYFSVEAHPKTLTPEDFSALFSYVRGSFGNTAKAVCPTEITIPVP